MAKKSTSHTKASATSVKVSRPDVVKNDTPLERFQFNREDKKSYLNLILGALIVVVAGVLLFNYFSNNNNPTNDQLGPAQETEQADQSGDVNKDQLPGKYTVKEGDTLFTIAEKYYDDGFQYTKIVEANKLANENVIENGLVLEIPKVETQQTAQNTESTQPSLQPSASSSPTPEPTAQAEAQTSEDQGTGGAENQTTWGEKITTDTYTVQADDWLSKIAGRAYGDVTQYQKIAQANNIQNPDIVEIGTILKIPR